MRLLWVFSALALCLPLHAEAAAAAGGSHHSTCCGSHKGWKRNRDSSPDSAPGTLGQTSRGSHPGTLSKRGQKGHVIDGTAPLACGGTDSASNLQGQTKAEAKSRSKVEPRKCSRP